MFDKSLALVKLQFIHSELHRWLSLFPKNMKFDCFGTSCVPLFNPRLQPL